MAEKPHSDFIGTFIDNKSTLSYEQISKEDMSEDGEVPFPETEANINLVDGEMNQKDIKHETENEDYLSETEYIREAGNTEASNSQHEVREKKDAELEIVNCDNVAYKTLNNVESVSVNDLSHTSNAQGENDNDSVPEYFSDQSESGDEYESAEEGEEIQTDSASLKELEEKLTEEEKQERQSSARELKEEGNQLFRDGSFKSAIRMYSRGLRICPLKYEKDRAVLYANRAACKVKLEEFDDAIKNCSKAIDLNPDYMKALIRRAELYEQTEKLDEALADYQKILELDPSQHKARAACMKLPDMIKERNEKLKEEMMGKLKELGNMVLRPFGLSTNNFKLNQDPNTGGYSVNFVQNPTSGE